MPCTESPKKLHYANGIFTLSAGLGVWGAINLLEGYGNDNPGANAHVR